MSTKDFKELVADIEATARKGFEESYDLLRSAQELPYRDASRFKLALMRIIENSHTFLMEINALLEQIDWTD